MISLTPPTGQAAAGTVVVRTGRRHTVAMDDGRVLLADSGIAHNPGARVLVLAGVIVGEAGAAPRIANYQE